MPSEVDPDLLKPGIVWHNHDGSLVIVRDEERWILYPAANYVPQGPHLSRLKSSDRLLKRYKGDLTNWVWDMRSQRLNKIDEMLTRLSNEIGALKDERAVWKSTTPGAPTAR